MALDDAGAGNWRDASRAVLRGSRARVTCAATPRRARTCRRSSGDGATLGVFTDAPEELARTALAQLGASRRISALETGTGALERLLDALGGDATVVRTRADLLNASVEFDAVEQHDVGDRQLDALLERLDRIADELERLNRTTERQEGFTLVARELHDLQESLNALAYAALGQAPPRVRRRAS